VEKRAEEEKEKKKERKIMVIKYSPAEARRRAQAAKPMGFKQWKEQAGVEPFPPRIVKKAGYVYEGWKEYVAAYGEAKEQYKTEVAKAYQEYLRGFRQPIGSLAYRQAVEGRVQMTPEILEKQIQFIYSQAPVVTKSTARGKPVSYQYVPTPEQQQQIIALAKQLPPEKAEKYITIPEVKEEPKGLAEQLLGFDIKGFEKFIAVGLADLVGLTGEAQEKFYKRVEETPTGWSYIQPRLVTGEPMPFFGEPVQAIAGVVAPFESAVYGGERLVSAFITKHEPITPRPPPTYIGGVVSTALGDPSQYMAAEEYGASYMAGTILGDVLLGYVIGKGIAKTPIAKPILKLEEKIIGKLPAQLKKYFIKTELEVQRRYDPHALYALKQARYRPHYALKSDLAKFIQTTSVTTKPVHTPFTSTLAKTIPTPTSTGQIILQKTTLETAKRLPTLTLVKTVSPLVKAVAPKVVTKTTQIILGKAVVHPFVWAGARLPSLVGVSWTQITKPKIVPFPVTKVAKTPSLSELIISKIVVWKEAKVVVKKRLKEVTIPSVSEIITPAIIPAVTPKPAQITEIIVSSVVSQVAIQRTLQIQRQIQKRSTLQELLLGKPSVERKKKRKRRKKVKVAKPKFGLREYMFPVATTSEVAKYILGKK